uniref:Uncharacterized protein n=1 Tax=Arundo donax TaxID=35708 RepID=A0A0A9E710_ARUDO
MNSKEKFPPHSVCFRASWNATFLTTILSGHFPAPHCSSTWTAAISLGTMAFVVSKGKPVKVHQGHPIQARKQRRRRSAFSGRRSSALPPLSLHWFHWC